MEMELFKNYNFLLVDDEKDQIDVLKIYFEGKFDNIFQASNGIEALEVLKKEKIDIVLSDLSMPKMSGLELLDEINKLEYDLEFILISGFAGLEESRQAMQNGAFDIIDKPYTKEFVCTRVKNALYKIASKRVQNQILITLSEKLNYQTKINLNEFSDEKRLIYLNAINSVLKFHDFVKSKNLPKTEEFFELPQLQKKIDQQHNYLFELLDKLREGIQNNVKFEMNLMIIEELIEYTNFHFSFEEELLAGANYPELETHKKLHQKFTSDIINFKENELGKDAYTTIKLVHLIKEWLTQHICKEDLKYKDYI